MYKVSQSPLKTQTYSLPHPSVTFLHAPVPPLQMTMQLWHLGVPSRSRNRQESRNKRTEARLRQMTKPPKVNAHHVWNREPRGLTWLQKARPRHPDRHEALQPLINAILWLITSSADVIFNDTSHQNASAWMDGRLEGG